MIQHLIKDHEIILASGSPRRQKFFEDLLIPVTIDVRSVEEIYPEDLKGDEITDFRVNMKITFEVD